MYDDPPKYSDGWWRRKLDQFIGVGCWGKGGEKMYTYSPWKFSPEDFESPQVIAEWKLKNEQMMRGFHTQLERQYAAADQIDRIKQRQRG